MCDFAGKMMDMSHYTLTDAQFECLKKLMSGKPADRGVTAKDNRLFVDAFLSIQKTAVPWYDTPECFGKWNSVFTRFNRWTNAQSMFIGYFIGIVSCVVGVHGCAENDEINYGSPEQFVRFAFDGMNNGVLMEALDSALNGAGELNIHDLEWKKFNALVTYLSQSLVVGDNSWAEHYRWYEVNARVKVKVDVAVNTIDEIDCADTLLAREVAGFDEFRKKSFRTYSDFLEFAQTSFCASVDTLRGSRRSQETWKLRWFTL